MVEFARMERACFPSIRAATAHESEAVWFRWVGKDGSRVHEFGGWVLVQLLEDCLPLRRWCVVEEVAWVAIGIAGCPWDSVCGTG